MELQWPLILFTSLLAWAAGTFAMQGVLAIQQRSYRAQLPTLITAFAIMAVGGVAVMFHLQHPLRIFNGFGHITSGITQELIAVVLVGLVMVVYFAQLRRRGDNLVPKWVGVLAIVTGIILIIAMGHSYMMASRPVWDSVLQILSLFGAAFVLGPATVAVCLAICKDDVSVVMPAMLAGAAVNLVTTVAYLVFMAAAQANYTDIGYYYDPTQLARGMIDFQAVTGLFAGERAILTAATIVCAVAAVVIAALIQRKFGKDSGKAQLVKVLGIALVVLGVATAILLRVVFYDLGLTVYMFY